MMIDGNREAEPMGVCWSCQLKVNTANCVKIDEMSVNICKGCWNDLTPSARIMVAHKLKSGVGIADALDAFKKVVQGDETGWERILGSG